MFLGDSIGRAVEELWQLAMTMASLKHIAGMVTQELQTTTASTGLGEENIETDDSHRTSQVDKTEAVGNECFANNDVIDTEDTKQDAFFCSSAHKKETASHPQNVSTEKKNEKVFEPISMVAHKLPQHDALQEISEFPVSMAAHAILTDDKEERMEKHENISMRSHLITEQYTSIEPAIMDEEPQISSHPSICTHEMSYLETAAESSEDQVSMVAHHQHKFDNNSINHEEDLVSMVCHQTSEHYIDEEFQVGELEQEQEQDQELVEEERTDQVENLIFIPSMVNHQLSENEFLLDVSEIPASMTTHTIATNDIEDTTETSQTISMIAHQILTENESIVQEVPSSINEDTDSLDHEQMLEEGACFIPSVCTPGVFNDDTRVETAHHEFKLNEEEQHPTIAIMNEDMCEYEEIYEPTFLSSMVAHQLAPCDNALESSEVPLTMAAHGIRPDLGNTADTSQHMSMIGHQITNNVIDMEQTMKLSISKKMEESNISNIIYPSMSTHEMPYLDTPVEPMEYQVSMVTHFQHTPEDNEVDVLSMLCHQAMVHNNIKQEEISKTGIISARILSNCNEEAVLTPESTFSSSMVAHKLPPFDTLLVYPDMPATMAAHLINTLSMDEHGKHQNISMMVHQIINEDQSTLPDTNVFNKIPADKIKENDVAYEEVCEENNEMVAKENFLLAESVLNPALSTEQDPFSGGSNNHQECPALISVCVSEKSVAVSGQIKDNPATGVCNKEANIIEHAEEMYSKSLKHNYLDTFEVHKPSFLSSMLSHQLSYMEIPNEFQDFSVSSTTHGYSFISSEDHGLASSMLSHQIQRLIPKSTTIEDAKEEDSENLSSLVSHQLPLQDDNYLATADTHGPQSTELDSSLQSGLNNAMLAHLERIINKEDLTEKLEIMEQNPSYNVDPEGVPFMTSLASHQLPSLSPFDQLESLDCFTSMAAHQDMAARERRDFISMATHIASNDVSTAIKHKALVAKDKENKNKPNAIIESLELVENKTRSYTEGSHMVEHKEDLPQEGEKSSNDCQGKIPVGTEEGETTETFDNFEHAANNNEVVNSFNLKLDRILELQRIVEDEIEEFEHQKSNNSKIIENNVETTETQIVSNVKNVEFQSCIVVHQQVNKGFESEQFTEEHIKTRNKENWMEDDSFSSSSESVNSVVFTTSENLISNDKSMELNEDESHSETNSDHEDVEENVIKASCTLENNSPVIITANPSPAKCLEFVSKEEGVGHTTEQHDVIRDNQQAENYDEYFEGEFDELKMEMRKIPRRSSNATTKIRETELLNSFFKEELKEVDEKFMKKQQEKAIKSSMTLTTFNDNVKKQTYKIRFKVSLNKDSSESSVLHYLLGCFGGEKMFQQK